MPRTRSFAETVKIRAERDPVFYAALLKEAVDALLAPDIDTARTVLRDYVNATASRPSSP